MSNQNDTWAGGAEWIFQATLAGDNAGGADYTFTLTPGAGSELWIHAVTFSQADTVARAVTTLVDDGTNVIYFVGYNSTNLNAGTAGSSPAGGSAAAATGNQPQLAAPIYLAGPMRYKLVVAAMAQNKVLTVSAAARVNGSAPTVTGTVSAGIATFTQNVNKVV